MIHRWPISKHVGIRPAYVLLETVLATGMLIIGLAVIGAQVQDSDRCVKEMKRGIRAVSLAEQLLAELDMGLLELESVDEEEEEDFGPRHPNYGWRLITEKTAIEEMYLLQIEILYLMREDEYREDDFEHDDAEVVYTLYVMRPAPKPVDFVEDFGLSEEEATELSEKFDALGIEGLSIDEFNPSLLRDLDFEELLAALPVVMDALGMDASQILGMLPPDVMQQLQESGLLEGEGISDILEGLGGSEE